MFKVCDLVAEDDLSLQRLVLAFRTAIDSAMAHKQERRWIGHNILYNRTFLDISFLQPFFYHLQYGGGGGGGVIAIHWIFFFKK